jgi:hypothetical protein
MRLPFRRKRRVPARDPEAGVSSQSLHLERAQRGVEDTTDEPDGADSDIESSTSAEGSNEGPRVKITVIVSPSRSHQNIY